MVGERKRVDVALPAGAPLYEYSSSLARLCELPEDELLPPAWSLAPVGRRPLALETSLAAAGIVDGAVLHLRDLLAGEADTAVVLDLDEEVTEAAARLAAWPWDRARRSLALLTLAALWLLAVPVLLAATLPRASVLASGLPAILCALLAAGLAFAARRGDWPVPPRLRVLTSLVAVPDAALAAARIAGPQVPAAHTALDAALGALLGSVAVLLAAPGLAAVALSLSLVFGLAVTSVLGVLGAAPVECAALVAATALGIGSFAPWTVGRFVAYSMDERRLGEADSDTIAGLVLQSRQLLTAVRSVIALLLGVSSVLLAGSGDPYGLGLAGAVALALFVRTSAFRLFVEALPALAAGSAGVLTIAYELPARLAAPAWAGPAAVSFLGLGLGLVTVWSMTRGDRREPRRPGWHALTDSLFSTASVPLAVGVFGVYAHMVAMGHGM